MADIKHSAGGRPKIQPRSSPRTTSTLDYVDSEPLSLAEELAEEADRLAQQNQRFERIKHDGDIHIAELQRMTMPQLIEQARSANVADINGLKKQELIFRILKERVSSTG